MQYIYNMAITSLQQLLIGFFAEPVLENVWPIPAVAGLFKLENLLEVMG